MLDSARCPLKNGEKKLAIQRIRYKKSRAILSAAKHYSIKKALELKKESGMSYSQLLRNLYKK